jgi:hypothetical protein
VNGHPNYLTPEEGLLAIDSDQPNQTSNFVRKTDIPTAQWFGYVNACEFPAQCAGPQSLVLAGKPIFVRETDIRC